MVQDINDKYFGKDPSKRYLVKALRKCTENLVATEIALRLHDEIKLKHTCPNNENTIASCAYCDSYNTMVDAYLDAAFLSARLVFAEKHGALASEFISDVQALDKQCIEQYYRDVYEYDFTDKGELEELHKLANTAAQDIKTKYKTIGSYQAYKFHQPNDQVVSTVTKKLRELGGYKLDLTEKKPKQSNNTKDLLDMLTSLASLVDRYSHLVSLSDVNWQIPVERTVKALVLLFSVDISYEKENKIISETEKFIKPINKMLNCGVGLTNHNHLQLQKVQNHVSI